MMNANRLQQCLEKGVLIDLSNRCKFQLNGSDRVRYLNGQITQDVRNLNSSNALPAFICNLKGKIEAPIHLQLGETADTLWVDAEPDLRDALEMRLDRYIIADDVELADITSDWQLFHVTGAARESFLKQPHLYAMRHSNRYNQPGLDLWLPKSTLAPDTDAISLSPNEVEYWRIYYGVPTWPQELNSSHFPHETGLEDQTMSYTKGCYIGQEILSRIKTTGKMPKQLHHLQFSTENLPAHTQMTSLKIAAANHPLQVLGEFSSIIQHPTLDRIIGLAYLRHGWDDSHSLVLITEPPSSTPIYVEPVSLQ